MEGVFLGCFGAIFGERCPPLLYCAPLGLGKELVVEVVIFCYNRQWKTLVQILTPVKNTGAKFMSEHLSQMGEMPRSEINNGVANAVPCDPRCKRGPVGDAENITFV